MADSQRKRIDALRVLLIEDNPGDARLFEEHLRETMQEPGLRWERDLAAGISALDGGAFDVVALDLGLPDSEGTGTVEQMRAVVPEIPIVVLTGQESEDRALSMLEVGATEYIRKSELAPSLLVRTLRWAVERKSMEQTLEKREQQLRSITENISEGIYRSAPDEGLVYVNQAFADLYGYESPEEITSVDPVELYVHPERREELRDLLRSEGHFQNEEVECRRKDGSTFTVLQSGSVVRDEDGEVRFYDGAVTDITERRKREQELAEREARLRAITQSARDAIVTIDPDSTIQFANPAVENVFGYTADELVGTSVTTLMPERFRDEHQDGLDRFLETGERHMDWSAVEFPGLRKDGEEIDLSLSFAEYEQQGTPHFVAVIRDVTKRKEAQRKIERSEALTRSVLDALAANVAVLDRDGTIIDVNRKWNQFARENDGDLDALGVGANYLTACAPAEEAGSSAIPTVREEICAVAEGEQELFEYQYPCHGPDEERWFLLRATPLDREEGGAVVAHINVTERVQAVQKQRVLSTAIEQAQDAVLITGAEAIDESGPEIVYANSAVEAMTGYAEAELLGQTPRILQGPDTEREVLESLREALEAGDEWTGETVNYRKDGTPYRVQWSVTPVRGEKNGEIEYWVSVQRDVTEEREREKRLAQLVQALEQVGDKVFITDREGRIQYVNEAFEEITGYREDEVVGETPAVLQSGEQDEAFYEEMWDAILSGETFRAEFIHEKKDGTRYVVDESISPLRNEEGEITHFVFAGRDVTDRKEREEALHRHRNLLQQTQRLAGAWEVDLQSGELSWSDEVYRIHEVKPGTEIEVEGAIEFYAPEARPKIREAFERCVEEGESYDLELPLDTAKGNRRWIRTVGAPAEREDGEVVKVAGAFQDITDRKEAEQALREREARLRGLANSIPGVLFQYEVRADGTQGFSFVSDRAEEILGLRADPDGFLERAVQLVPQPHGDTLLDSIEEAIQNRSEWSFEAPFDKPSGERVWIRGMSIPDVQDSSIVFNGVLLDVTERKAAEQALKESEELQRATLSHISDTVLLTRADGTFSYVCPNVSYIFDYDEEEVEALGSISALLGSDPAEEHDFEGRQEISNVEHTALDASGDRHDLLINIRRVAIQDGRRMYTCRDITERKQAEEALREREAQLRGLANSIPGVVYQFYAQPDGMYGNHFVSEHAQSLLGIAPEADDFFERVVGRIPPTHRDEFLASVDEAVEQEATWRHEFPYQHPSGEVIWVLGTSTPEHRNGELIFNGVLLNVTERKKAERALEEREEYLSVTLQSIGDAVVATDRDGYVTEMNAVAERLTGWDQEEAKGKLLDDILTLHNARTGEAVESPAEEVLQGGKIVGFANDTVLTSRDGIEYQIEDSAAPIQSEGGDLLGVVLVFRDITEKYERRRRMERQNDLFAQAQDLAKVGGWEYDVETGVHSWTDEVYRIYGLPKSFDPTVQEGIAHYHPDDRPTIREVFTRAVEEGESYDIELRLISADGEEKWVRTRGEPQVEEGDIVRVRGSIQDITERREREEELWRAKKEAEQMNRLKDAFLANMSHEIRTPLTSILGFAEIIGNEVETQEPRDTELDLSTLSRYSSLIRRSGQRLMETLEEVLNLSKLEAGEMNLSGEIVDLGAEAMDIVEQFEPQARDAGLALDAEVPEEAIRALVDPKGLRIALRNLVNNATKYTEEGGQVWVRVRREGDASVVEVEDTGIGMDPERVPKLFEAFVQESEGIGREYEGSGLGLAVTKRIIDQMGGSINVTTEKGEGSCFTVRLPRAEG